MRNTVEVSAKPSREDNIEAMRLSGSFQNNIFELSPTIRSEIGVAYRS